MICLAGSVTRSLSSRKLLSWSVAVQIHTCVNLQVFYDSLCGILSGILSKYFMFQLFCAAVEVTVSPTNVVVVP